MRIKLNKITEQTTLALSAQPDISTELNWPSPIPLLGSNESTAHPYPVGCLPSLIRDAVLAYQQYGQQPLPLIACSALANVSLACQALANVARDHYLVSPISLYFLVIAGSGERKSAADHIFSNAIRQWELKTREKLAPQIRIARTLHQAWVAEKEGLLAQIRRSGLTGENTEALKQKFVEIMQQEPIIPLLPVLFFEDATQEALTSHMAHGWPSASLWSDEGGIVLAGHGMQNNTTKFVALLNRLWDGKAFITHRKTSQSFTVANRRLTVSLMLQPLILQQMLAKNGGVSRQSGFLARSLLAYPVSAMGTRYYQEPPANLDALPYFHQRLTECLDTSLALDLKGCHETPSLLFSEPAKTIWVSFFNNVEMGLKKSSHWSSIKDFASKAAENAARLSALLHLFEGRESQMMSSECTERAIQIIHWHLLETRNLLDTQPQTYEHQDAIKLLNWIHEKALQETTPRYLQQYGPIREKPRRDKAIKTLIENHYFQESKVDGKTLLMVNPQVFRYSTSD